MKAAIYERYGPPEVVYISEINKPVPGEKDLLIRVRAATVNRTDSGFRSAEYGIIRLFQGLFAPRKKVLGCEFAGEVEAVGSGVTAFRPGDRVYGFDDSGWGAHAQYKVIAQHKGVALIPGDMPYTVACALSEASHYALCNLRAAAVGQGTRLLVNGGTGAIGSAAVQLGRHFGARVTAVCDTVHMGLLESIGAHRVIDYTKEDFTKCGQTFDVVFDAVGKSTFGKCKGLLVPNGVYISTEPGPRGQNVFLGIAGMAKRGKRVLFPIPVSKKEDIELLGELAAAGAWKPLIDRTYPFSQIVEAYRYVDTGMKTGNVVIEID